MLTDERTPVVTRCYSLDRTEGWPVFSSPLTEQVVADWRMDRFDAVVDAQVVQRLAYAKLEALGAAVEQQHAQVVVRKPSAPRGSQQVHDGVSHG